MFQSLVLKLVYIINLGITNAILGLTTSFNKLVNEVVSFKSLVYVTVIRNFTKIVLHHNAPQPTKFQYVHIR